jgi:hypothetical protein
MRKLLDELEQLDPDRNISLLQFEQMPYLVSTHLKKILFVVESTSISN